MEGMRRVSFRSRGTEKHILLLNLIEQVLAILDVYEYLGVSLGTFEVGCNI
jgi:hypothetical protein